MSFGWGGEILHVDLTKEKITKVPTKRYSSTYISGRGINAKILYDGVTPGVDAYSPENIIVFGAGVLVGTLAPCAGRTDVTAKSPLSGLQGIANFGGFFGAELKYAGYDNIALKGRAKRPAYLWINNGSVEIRDATHIWGTNAFETMTAVQKDLGDKEVKVVCIGPAGENLVRFACLEHDLGDGGSRTGVGAVMGSKNLKAIAVRGTKGLKIAKPTKFLEACTKLRERITPEENEMDTEAHFARIAATRARGRFIYGEMNWALTGNQQGMFDGEFKANYNEQQFRSRYTVRKRACFGCPIACMLFIDVPNVGLGLQSCQGFWEPSFSLRIPKFEKVFEFSRMCEMMGVDILSASHTLSAMMELYERGIITEKDTDGLKLEWGNGDNAIKMLKKMVYREGFGDILAEGSMRATRKIGRGAEKYAMHTKGVENSIYDLRGFKGCALATAVSPGHIFRGIPMEYYFRQIEYISPEEKKRYYDFASVFSKNKKAVEPNTYEGKPEAVIFQEHEHMVMDMMGICVWATSWLDIPPEKLYSFDVLELFSTCTGIDNGAVVLEAAERAFNLERAFNVREGLTTKSETLADRYFSDPLPGGVYKGEKLDKKKFEAMKEEYYRLRGWDITTGLPTPKKLKALGLNSVVNELMLDKNA